MQSDAFPTPPIYSYKLQPRLVLTEPEQTQDRNLNSLLHEIELLMTDCSIEEAQHFWVAADRIKVKHRVMDSMQKIESLFLELAKESTQNPDLLSAVSDSLRYSSHFQSNFSGDTSRTLQKAT